MKHDDKREIRRLLRQVEAELRRALGRAHRAEAVVEERRGGTRIEVFVERCPCQRGGLGCACG